jgi:three-Cys-motif partner protein
MAEEYLYGGREQTEAKHQILRQYLENFSYKILQTFGSLDYVDAFCGPWKERDTERFSDTSFGIAIDTLRDVQLALRQRGRNTKIRCIFNEADPQAFDRLETFISTVNPADPEFEIICLKGSFEENASRIERMAVNRFRLFFIDPTGWKGYGPTTLSLLERGRSEVLINFMFDHINRFLVSDDGRSRNWLDDLIGAERTDTLFARAPFSAADIKDELAGFLRDDLNYKYVASSPIFMPRSERINFELIYASRHPAGIEVLRNAEFRALSAYDQKRYEMTQNPNQGTLFDIEPQGPYLRAHGEHIRVLETEILDCIPDGASVGFAELCGRIQCRLYVSKKEVKKAIVDLAKQGVLQESWRARNPKARSPSDDDEIARV